MDIWAWVERVQDELERNGQERLAELMSLIPTYACDNMHAQLDGVMPEALALARSTKNPWIEVFLRHWNLQSHILHRHHIKDFLAESVDLIDFANQPETKDCPQSVCTTQDLAACYGNADGPGYAPERLAVANETLSRITPSWPCFSCISAEYASALLDDKRPQEALEFLDRQRTAMRQVGRDDDFRGTRVEALLRLDRIEEALEVNERSDSPEEGGSFLLSKSIDTARILCRLGRLEEATQVLPTAEAVSATHSNYWCWCEGAYHLTKEGALHNDWMLHAQMAKFGNELEKNGVARGSFDIAIWQAELALLRRQPQTAAHSLEQSRQRMKHLHRSLDAPDKVAVVARQVRAALKEAPEVVLPDDPKALQVPENDLESAIEILRKARAAWPEEEGILLSLAESLAAVGSSNEAIVLLLGHHRSHPDDADVILQIGHLLRAHRPRSELDLFVEEVLDSTEDAEVKARCLWILACDDFDANNMGPAKERLERILHLKPEARNSRMMLAQIERESGRPKEAMIHLDRLAELDPEPGDHTWERMIVATILERWEIVRESAFLLDIELLDEEGPVDEPWGLCRVQFTETDGSKEIVFAERTGPVTARIIELSQPGGPQHYDDRVVFRARPVNGPPEEGEEDHTFIFPSVHLVSGGNYTSYAIDGAHPGVSILDDLKTELHEMGCLLEQRSDDEYVLFNQETNEELPGIFCLVGVPDGVSLKEVDELMANCPGPLVWPEILYRLGDKEGMSFQESVMERWSMV